MYGLYQVFINFKVSMEAHPISIYHSFLILSRKHKKPGKIPGLRILGARCDICPVSSFSKEIPSRPISSHYFISFTSTAFWAWRRFSASSKISPAWASNTLAVISSSLWAGRQCSTMASGLAAAMTASLI